MFYRSGDILDIKDLVNSWVKYKVATTASINIPLGELAFIFDWSKASLIHQRPTFIREKSPPTPILNLLCQATYDNQASRTQVNLFQVSRSTTSFAEVSVDKGVLKEASFFQLALPSEVRMIQIAL